MAARQEHTGKMYYRFGQGFYRTDGRYLVDDHSGACVDKKGRKCELLKDGCYTFEGHLIRLTDDAILVDGTAEYKLQGEVLIKVHSLVPGGIWVCVDGIHEALLIAIMDLGDDQTSGVGLCA